MDGAAFKTCRVCEKTWDSREEFIADVEVSTIGYQENVVNLEKGLFLFNHSCDGTLSIPVQAFSDLYMGPIVTQRKAGTEVCPGHCLHGTDLRPCPVECECNFVRVILQVLINTEKSQKSLLSRTEFV